MTRLEMRSREPSLELRIEKLLENAAEIPGNELCADCKAEAPRWSAWNHGILICISCSGKHRSLGTHISKVKSLDLDKWTLEQNLYKWGNKKANTYWEAGIPVSDLARICHKPDFIQQKYQERKFATGPTTPDPDTICLKNSQFEPDVNETNSTQSMNFYSATALKEIRTNDTGLNVFDKKSKNQEEGGSGDNFDIDPFASFSDVRANKDTL